MLKKELDRVLEVVLDNIHGFTCQDDYDEISRILKKEFASSSKCVEYDTEEGHLIVAEIYRRN